MTATTLNLNIRSGETFQRVIRWEMPPYIYIPITAISNGAPVTFTAPGHGLITGWRSAVTGVVGMAELNAQYTPPRDSDFQQVTVVDSNHVSFNNIDSSLFIPYVSGGFLMYWTPVNLTGFSASMDIKDGSGNLLYTLTSGADAQIILSPANNTISLYISKANTTAFTTGLVAPNPWAAGVYDLEMLSPTGFSTTIYTGNVTVQPGVTL
jgi:hypothetical protein